MPVLTICEKFSKLKTRCTVKHTSIDVSSPNSKLKFRAKNSKLFSRE